MIGLDCVLSDGAGEGKLLDLLNRPCSQTIYYILRFI